jgi:hypothetical protein
MRGAMRRRARRDRWGVSHAGRWSRVLKGAVLESPLQGQTASIAHGGIRNERTTRETPRPGDGRGSGVLASGRGL